MGFFIRIIHIKKGRPFTFTFKGKGKGKGKVQKRSKMIKNMSKMIKIDPK